jgi:hypothetical protein
MKTIELFEAKPKQAPDWAQAEQLEFANFVKKFNFRLMTRKLEFRAPDQWMVGGEIKDIDKTGADDIGLSPERRFAGFKKQLAAFLLKKAKEFPDRYVKIISSPRNWNPSPHYIKADDTSRQVEDIIDNCVYQDTSRSTGRFFIPMQFMVLWSISEPK